MNISSYGSAIAIAWRTLRLSNGATCVFMVMWVKPLVCGMEATLALAECSIVWMSLAARSIDKSASPRSIRLARVAGSGTVCVMTLRNYGSSPHFHTSLRRMIVLSPGLWLSTM